MRTIKCCLLLNYSPLLPLVDTPLSLLEATLCNHLLEKKMFIEEKVNAMKGQQMSAQGNALGIKANKEIVRTITFIKEKTFFRTKQ